MSNKKGLLALSPLFLLIVLIVAFCLASPRWRYIVLRRIASKRPLLFDPK